MTKVDDDAVLERDPEGGVLFYERQIENRQETIRALLALSFVVLLAVMLVLVVTLVACKRITVHDSTDLFAVILPSLTGLLGAATGFYYAGRSRGNSKP
jgi:hypothetical protein